ncbi:MAG: TIGR02270 family protein [Desulfobacteraceae bacterium]|nr:TIGR02270 family protein [Desulfobacteraceae bacterium]
MAIISVVIDQHAEEAAFLWIQRNSAIEEPHYDLEDLAGLDGRVEAHLDGLRIAGEYGWQICKETMAAFEEPGETFVAGVLAFESKDPERMDAMLAAVEMDDELLGALICALGWLPFDQVCDPVSKLMTADLSFLKRIGLAAHAIHRQHPGNHLAEFINDPDPALRARALKAAAELGLPDLRGLIANSYKDDDQICRFYAAWSGALLGDANAVSHLLAFAEKENPFAEKAVNLAVRCMALQDARTWLNDLAQNKDLLRLSIRGYAGLGDPQIIPWLIGAMQTPELARPAGEALSMITGVDIAYKDLETDEPEGFETEPGEDDDDIEPDADEDLPWPDPDLIDSWWRNEQKHYRSGIRYLAGKPLSEIAHLESVLKSGLQRQRISAALELCLSQPAKPLFECRAPGNRQQQMLGIKV